MGKLGNEPCPDSNSHVDSKGNPIKVGDEVTIVPSQRWEDERFEEFVESDSDAATLEEYLGKNCNMPKTSGVIREIREEADKTIVLVGRRDEGSSWLNPPVPAGYDWTEEHPASDLEKN